MTTGEMTIFLASVILPVLLIVGVAWYCRWKRDPARFKEGFRTGPNAGGPDHWNRPK